VPRPAIAPTCATLPAPAARTSCPARAARSTPRWPRPKRLVGGWKGRSTRGAGASGQAQPSCTDARGGRRPAAPREVPGVVALAGPDCPDCPTAAEAAAGWCGPRPAKGPEMETAPSMSAAAGNPRPVAEITPRDCTHPPPVSRPVQHLCMEVAAKGCLWTACRPDLQQTDQAPWTSHLGVQPMIAREQGGLDPVGCPNLGQDG
jgi:hypothetical protein